MLRIVEISNAEQLTTERAKEIITNDYLYILKYNNSFLLVDDGNVHHMNSIIECTQEEYDLLSEIDSKLLYLVSEVVDEKTKYSIYYNGLKISADSHTHENKDILDKISESETGKFLFNGEEISGGSSGGGEIDPEQLEEINSRINDLNLRSVIGEKLDYIHVVLSTNQIMVQNDFVKFDKVIESNNMTLDPVSYTIPLKKGKTYEISINMYTYVKKDFAQVMVRDLTNDRSLVLSSTLSVTHTVQNTPSPFGSTIYTPDTDCIIGAKIVQTVGGTINNTFGAFMTVKEIGRIHIVDPMDVKDKHVVEYGRFVLSENQTTDLIVGTHIKFDTDVYTKNLTIDPLTHTVKLKANKVYMIEVNLLVGGTVANYFKIKNVTDDVFLDGRLISIPVTSTRDHNSQDSISTLIETTKDIEIAVVFEFAGGTITTIFSDYSYLNIQEIAQPVVTEYNKEISNPLTTTDISQESPVGSVIEYVGNNAPEHYLACDGSEYNIADYPYLAEHFKREYGVYNYFGGDDITTFTVPDESKYIINHSPIMTSNTTPAPFVALASSEYNSLYRAWKAFNGRNTAETDSWVSLYTSAGWLQIDLGKAVLLKSFIISSRSYSNNSSSYAPKDFTLQGSNNGLDFTVLSTLIGETNWGNAETREYQVNSLISYRYYRLDITANNGGTNTSIGNFILNSVTVNNQFIKYEPTHYAVNQYGGFESTEVYSGSHSTIGEITLNENINDYNYVEIETINSNGQTNSSFYTINSEKNFILTELDRYINFKFINNVTLQIAEVNGLSLVSVKLIKGMLPSLLTGGEF